MTLLEKFLTQKSNQPLFGVGEDKSPEPDGFTSSFFKKAWNIIGNDFCGAVKEFFCIRSASKTDQSLNVSSDSEIQRSRQS